MKKHRVLLDMIKNFIIFSLGYYMHLGASLFPISPKPKKLRQSQIWRYYPKTHWKKWSKENLDDFLYITKKLLNKKRRLINSSKQELSMGKQKSKTVVISSLDNSGKKDLLILILILILDKIVVMLQW